jgi:hypothetical protein
VETAQLVLQRMNNRLLEVNASLLVRLISIIVFFVFVILLFGVQGRRKVAVEREGLYGPEPLTISIQPSHAVDLFVQRFDVLNRYSYFVFAFGYYVEAYLLPLSFCLIL